MKNCNLISVVLILIFGLFDIITAMVIPSDCTVIEKVINTIGNDLQKTYKDLNIVYCCDFPQITCQTFNNQVVVTEIKFNNYENLSNQDMGKIISQFAKLPYLTTLEMSNNLIVGEFPNNLSELKKLRKLDLSGNYLEDRNTNTSLNIEDLNLSKSDPFINQNKKVKDLGGNKIIKCYTIYSMVLISLGNYIVFSRIGRLIIDKKILYETCYNIYRIVYLYFHYFVYKSLLFGIKKGKLNLMKKFKYYFLVIILKRIIVSDSTKLIKEKIKK
jgi:hypothetical protein